MRRAAKSSDIAHTRLEIDTRLILDIIINPGAFHEHKEVGFQPPPSSVTRQRGGGLCQLRGALTYNPASPTVPERNLLEQPRWTGLPDRLEGTS